jgi:hypothetical protein
MGRSVEAEMQENSWVELSGGIVIARIRGAPTEAALRDVQERVRVVLKATGQRYVLYDALELEPPPLDTVLVQQRLTEELRTLGLRVAILVPNTRLAYLSRLAFGAAEHRVFYNDLAAAIRWLTEGPATGSDSGAGPAGTK